MVLVEDRWVVSPKPSHQSDYPTNWKEAEWSEICEFEQEPVAREPARSKDVGCSGESEPKLTEDLL